VPALVVHPEAETRRLLIEGLRRALPAAALHVAEAGNAPQALQCDASLQFGNATAHLGLAADRDVIDLLRDLDAATTLTPYLIHHAETGLNVLAPPREPSEAERLAPEDLSRALVALRRRFETLVVDLPAQIDLMSLAALDLADRIWVVTEAVAPSVVSTARLLGLLDEVGLGERVRVVVNQYSSYEGNLSEGIVAQRLGRPVDRVVPYDRAVVVAANRGTPFILAQKRGAFAEAIGELAGEFVESVRSVAAAAAVRR
jgi:pilus assembly protein CpaE